MGGGGVTGQRPHEAWTTVYSSTTSPFFRGSEIISGEPDVPAVFSHHLQHVLYEIRVLAVAPLEFDAVVGAADALEARRVRRQRARRHLHRRAEGAHADRVDRLHAYPASEESIIKASSRLEIFLSNTTSLYVNLPSHVAIFLIPLVLGARRNFNLNFGKTG